MNRKIIAALVLILSITVQSQTIDNLKDMSSSDAMKGASDAMGGSLASLLQSQLGMSEDQASGSMGSMLTLASEKLSSGEFDQLTGMIPGADKYLQSAKDLGAVSGAVGDMDGLMSSLGALGISEESVGKFMPMVKDYLGKLGGSDIQGLLAKAFG